MTMTLFSFPRTTNNDVGQWRRNFGKYTPQTVGYIFHLRTQCASQECSEEDVIQPQRSRRFVSKKRATDWGKFSFAWNIDRAAEHRPQHQRANEFMFRGVAISHVPKPIVNQTERLGQQPETQD
ncbi:hypothetical protein DMENIID0001_110800 [Sergentomyia squamirostris]